MTVVGAESLRPAMIGAAAGLAVHQLATAGCLPSFLKAIWQNGGAWAATFCFMLQPAVHLVCLAHIVDPPKFPISKQHSHSSIEERLKQAVHGLSSL